MKKLSLLFLTIALIMPWAEIVSYAQNNGEHGTITTLNNNVKLSYEIQGAIVKNKTYEQDGHRVVYECDVEDGTRITVSASIVSAPAGIEEVYIYHFFREGYRTAIKSREKGKATITYRLSDTESKESSGMETSIAAYGASSGTTITILWNVIKSTSSGTSSSSSSSSSSSTPTEMCNCDEEPSHDRIDSGIRFNELWGEVSLRPKWEYDDAYEYAEYDTIICECDLIRTKEDSGCVLGVGAYGRFEMKEESKLLIHTQTPRVTKLEMIAGSFWGNFTKLVQGKSLELEMSHHVLGIKGTIVGFEEKNGVSKCYLFAGKVEAKSKKTGKKTMLKPGQMCSTGSGGNVAVSQFDIEKMAKKFGIPMSEINNHYSNSGNSGSSSTSTTASKQRYTKKYGTVKYKVTEGQKTGEMTRWFDNYGSLERRHFKMKPASEPSLYLVIGDISYTLDTKKKTASLAKDAELNFRNLTTPLMKRLKLKKSGTGKILDKSCTIYSNSTMQFYVWEGVVLKKVQTVKGVKTVIEATSIDLKTVPVSSNFKLPAGYSTK